MLRNIYRYIFILRSLNTSAQRGICHKYYNLNISIHLLDSFKMYYIGGGNVYPPVTARESMAHAYASTNITVAIT